MKTEQDLINNFLSTQKAAEEAETIMGEYFKEIFHPLFDKAVTKEDYMNIKKELKERMPNCLERDMMEARLNRKIMAF